MQQLQSYWGHKFRLHVTFQYFSVVRCHRLTELLACFGITVLRCWFSWSEIIIPLLPLINNWHLLIYIALCKTLLKKMLKMNVELFWFSFTSEETLNIFNGQKLECVIKTVFSFYLKMEFMHRYTAFKMFPTCHSEMVLKILPFIATFLIER